jgi:hypothetical protein
MTLSNLRFEINKRRGISSSCTHLGFISDVTRHSHGCEARVALGHSWCYLAETIVASTAPQ